MKSLFFFILLIQVLIGSSFAQLETPMVEIFAGYSYLRTQKIEARYVSLDKANLLGGIGALAFNFNSWLGIVVEASSHQGSSELTSPEEDRTTIARLSLQQRSHTFLIGPQFSYRKRNSIVPFAHFMLGRISQGGIIGASFGQILPALNSYAAGPDFGLAAGFGLDVAIHRHVALRVIQLDYLRNFGGSGGIPPKTVESTNMPRISAGAVFRFGSAPWKRK